MKKKDVLFFGCDGNVHLKIWTEGLAAVKFTAKDLEKKGILEVYADNEEGVRLVRQPDGRWKLEFRNLPFDGDPLFEWEHEGYFSSVEHFIKERML